MAETEFFTIGQIVAPHGVRGDVRVYPDTDFPERFLTMNTPILTALNMKLRTPVFINGSF